MNDVEVSTLPDLPEGVPVQSLRLDEVEGRTACEDGACAGHVQGLPVQGVSEPRAASAVRARDGTLGLPGAGTLVVVRWRDAWFDFDGSAERDDYIAQTVGWVVNHNKDFLSVAQEELPDDDGWRAVTHLPLAMVLEWWEVQ